MNDNAMAGFGIVALVLVAWVAIETIYSHTLEVENAKLKKQLSYWGCTDRTPEQPGEPTLIPDVTLTDAYKSLLHQ